MANNEQSIWLAAGVRTPFLGVDGAFAHRDSLALSVPVVQAMAERSSGPIDFAVWGAVIPNLAYANLAREVWLEAKLNPHVPTFTTIMQCSTSMVGVFEAAGMLRRSRAALAMVGGVESMSPVEIGLGQSLSVWLRRVFQACSATEQRYELADPICAVNSALVCVRRCPAFEVWPVSLPRLKFPVPRKTFPDTRLKIPCSLA
jgi:acetyl-CoA C-acetyltransferase